VGWERWFSRHILEKRDSPTTMVQVRGEMRSSPPGQKTRSSDFFKILKNSLPRFIPRPHNSIRLRFFNVNFFYEPKLAGGRPITWFGTASLFIENIQVLDWGGCKGTLFSGADPLCTVLRDDQKT